MKRVAASALCLLSAASAFADEAEKKLPVTFGAFIDTYYAYDLNNPANRDRSFTTQPARHNEFNVNLAHIEAKLDADRFRGRLALQAGTSVQANYAGEPTVGQISGPNLARHLQEAYVGYRIADRLWVDGGIYFSHIGFESWLSKDNWGYSRLLMSDYSPYYQTGVKLNYQWNDQFYSCVHVINGWQNISENNGNKAVGAELIYTPSSRFTFKYNNFIGQEVGDRLRIFNDFIAKYNLTEDFAVGGAYDLGLQETPDQSRFATWQAYALLAHYQLTKKVALTVRGERYFDHGQIIVATGTEHGFDTWGASTNVDVALRSNILWRTELRGFRSDDSVYPSKSRGLSRTDGFVVTSLSLWI